MTDPLLPEAVETARHLYGVAAMKYGKNSTSATNKAFDDAYYQLNAAILAYGDQRYREGVEAATTCLSCGKSGVHLKCEGFC